MANVFFSPEARIFQRSGRSAAVSSSVDAQRRGAVLLVGAADHRGRLRLGRFLRSAAARSLFWLSARVLFLVSLSACVFMSYSEAGRSAFFYTSLRAWEFVAGGAVAALIPIVARRSRFLATYLFASGLFLIAAAVFLCRSTTVYPGWAALAPVFGACLVILGAEARRGGLAQRILFAPPVLALGLISYSVYLWHWPVLSLSRLASFGEMPVLVTSAAVAASVLFAVLTYVLVERPIREWRKGRGGHLGWWPVMNGVAACLILAGFALGYEQVLGKLNEGAVAVPRPDWPHECDLRFDRMAEKCLAEAEGYSFGIIMGDSHAGAAFPVFSDLAKSQGKRLGLLTFPGCAPFLDAARYGDGKSTVCGRLRTAAQSILESQADRLRHPRRAVGFSRRADSADQKRNGPGGPARDVSRRCSLRRRGSAGSGRAAHCNRGRDTALSPERARLRASRRPFWRCAREMRRHGRPIHSAARQDTL